MNATDLKTLEKADLMFAAGATVREVCKACGIAKNTALKLNNWGHLVDISVNGKTRINTGKRKDGTISFYWTSEIRASWLNQHYGKLEDLEFDDGELNKIKSQLS